MRKIQQLALSMEMIGFQSGVLFNLLTKVFEDVMAKPVKERVKAIKDSGLEGIIFTHTGMKVEVNIEKENILNAYVIPPEIDGNTSLWRDYGVFMDSEKTLKDIKAAEKKIWGGIDLKNSRVSGYFSELIIPAHLYMGILDPNQIQADEAAAILLHELGHAFTEFELLGNLCRLNACVGIIARETANLHEPQQVRKYLEEAEKVIGHKISSTDVIVNTPAAKRAKPEFQQVLITDVMLNSRRADGLSKYSVKTSEQIADQFAIRHGAGVALAEGLTKMVKDYAAYMRAQTIIGYIALPLFSVAAVAVSPLLGAGFILFLSYFDGENRSGLFGGRYDTEKDRIEMIRKQLIYQLKDRSIRNEDLKKLLDGLEKVKRNVDEVPGYLRSFFSHAAYFINSNERLEVRTQRFAKVAEDLLMNDLYLVSAKYRSKI